MIPKLLQWWLSLQETLRWPYLLFLNEEFEIPVYQPADAAAYNASCASRHFKRVHKKLEQRLAELTLKKPY